MVESNGNVKEKKADLSMLNNEIDILPVLLWRAWNGGYLFCMLLPLGENTGKNQWNMTLQDIQFLVGSLFYELFMNCIGEKKFLNNSLQLF